MKKGTSKSSIPEVLQKNELELLISIASKISKNPLIYTESFRPCAEAFCEIFSEILKKHEELIGLYHSMTDRGFRTIDAIDEMFYFYDSNKDKIRSRIEINIKQISNTYDNNIRSSIPIISADDPSTIYEINALFDLISNLGEEIISYINDQIIRNLDDYVIKLRQDMEYNSFDTNLGIMNRRRIEFEKANRGFRNELQRLVDRLRDLVLEFSKYGKIDICLK